MKQRNTQRFVFRIALTCCLLVVVGCGDSATNLTKIDVSPQKERIAAGASLKLIAIGTFSDSTKRDITEEVSWTTSDAKLAAPDATGQLDAKAKGTVVVTATFQEISGSANISITDADIKRVVLQVEQVALPVGVDLNITATAYLADDTNQRVSNEVTWTSSDGSVAKVDDTGKLTGLSPGTVTIKASLRGVGGEIEVMITDAALAAIEVSADRDELALGHVQRFTATGRYTDDTAQDITDKVEWSVDGTMATVFVNEGEIGWVRALGTGAATVTATLDGKTESKQLTIVDKVAESVQISTTTTSLAIGTAIQLQARVVFSDQTNGELVTTQVAWNSTNEEVAAFAIGDGAVPGYISGLAKGITEISGTLTIGENQVSGSISLEVLDVTLERIQVSSAEKGSLPQGIPRQLTALGFFRSGDAQAHTQDLTSFVAWDVTEETRPFARVDSKGIVTGIESGGAVIEASFDRKTGNLPLTIIAPLVESVQLSVIDPPSAIGLSTPVGIDVQLAATARFSNGTEADITGVVLWDSTNPEVLVVSNGRQAKGFANAQSPGSAVITVSFRGSHYQDNFTVLDAVLETISIRASAVKVPKGTVLSYRAVGKFSDGSERDISTQVTWSSKNEEIVRFLGPGRAETLGVGSTRVQARLGDKKKGKNLQVTSAEVSKITITPPGLQLANGVSGQLRATATYTDGETQDVTDQASWSAARDLVEVMAGTVTGRGIGATTVTAMLAGVSHTVDVYISPAVLEKLSIDPPAGQIPKGLTYEFRAVGTFSDGSIQDITAQVIWRGDAFAIVDNAPRNEGIATGNQIGTAQIEVAMPGSAINGNATLEVTEAVVQGIEIRPNAWSMPLGLSHQFAAWARLSDASESEVTNDVAWEITSQDGESILLLPGATPGLARSLTVGEATISATLQLAGAFQAEATVTVTSAELLSIAVAANNIGLPNGATQFYQATGTYTDGDRTITEDVTWNSRNQDVAVIANVAGARGLLNALSVGQTTVNAQLGDIVSPDSALTVTDAILREVRIRPNDVTTLPVGQSQQYELFGTYTDSTEVLLTEGVAWTSNDENIARVFNATQPGLVTPLALGTVLISAASQEKTDSIELAITNAP